MKEVRQSIHDAISQINDNALEALDLAQIKFGTSVTTPTSPISDYKEGTIYFNVETGIIWKLSGGTWNQMGTMKTIKSISKTSSSGLIDTYTITYSDDTTSTYTITNGEKGISVVDITKVSSAGNLDHYEVNLSDGTTTPNGFDIKNGADGVSVADIEAGAVVGNTKNYRVRLTDGTYTPNGFSVNDGTSNYIYIRYSASFDGTGMVTVPTASTVYIGIVVTTQSSAPTDPSVYSWVKFIGDSGTGTGDMLKTEYATQYAGVVDKAVALYDGTKEISATQLMDKDSYASKGVAGTVDKAIELVDVTNSKTADTVVLANLSDDAGQLKYKGNPIGGVVNVDNRTIINDSDTLKVPIDESTIVVKNNKVQVANSITDKLDDIDNKADYITYDEDTNMLALRAGGETGTILAEVEIAGGGSSTPIGSIVTPTDDIKTWLKCADVAGKDYTTIEQVLADTVTLMLLISNNNACDYMVRSTTWASTICQNENAMLYIGNSNYCSKILLNNEDWANAICNSTYYEKVLNTKVPVLTSMDASRVIHSGEDVQSGRVPYMIFDGNQNTLCEGRVSNGYSIGYDFGTKVCIKKIYIYVSPSSDQYMIDGILKGSNDNSTWNNVSTLNNMGLSKQYANVNQDNLSYRYWKVEATKASDPSGSNGYVQWWENNFYGREVS